MTTYIKIRNEAQVLPRVRKDRARSIQVYGLDTCTETAMYIYSNSIMYIWLILQLCSSLPSWQLFTPLHRWWGGMQCALLHTKYPCLHAETPWEKTRCWITFRSKIVNKNSKVKSKPKINISTPTLFENIKICFLFLKTHNHANCLKKTQKKPVLPKNIFLWHGYI